MSMTHSETSASSNLSLLLARLDDAITQLAEAPSFTRPAKVPRVLDTARRVMLQEGGCAALGERIETLEAAGIFAGTDWAEPHILVPGFTTQSLQSAQAELVVIEALSELRMLAVACGDYPHPLISAEQAHHFLTQVLALNLAMLFSPPSEAQRETQGRLAVLPQNLLQHLAERIGYEHIVDKLIEEIWRILNQRPIQTEPVKQMVTQIAICQANPDIDLGSSGQGADRLGSSLFGPTRACREDPGVEIYLERLASMDATALQGEATGFARAMHDTGLVSPYHPVLLRHLLEEGDHLVAEAMGLSSTGRDCLLCYRQLVQALIEAAVHPQTAQAIYGLALVLERGILYQPPVAPALWRQLSLVLSDWSCQRLTLAFGDQVSPQAHLIEGVLCMLGQPLGVGQGNNPTCQSARALSMWSYNDPDYLLQMVVWAARDDEIVMHFEGQPISSKDSASGVATASPIDLDPVSQLLVPHLDRIYAEMGRRCADRPGDPHRWVNPEFHGWWSARGFHINVDVATGNLIDLDDFIRQFHSSYHPAYNGGQPLIHPQPAGIAVTDSAARYIGWHAITILRVAPDPDGIMRVFFFNPNNDSGQDWGDGVVVGTAGNGEKAGEGSLPFEQFASRLYIFHTDPLENGEPEKVPTAAVDSVIGYIERSWGAGRLPDGTAQTSN